MGRILATLMLAAIGLAVLAQRPLTLHRQRARWEALPKVDGVVTRYTTGRHAGGRNGIDYRRREYRYVWQTQERVAEGPDIQQALWPEQTDPPPGAAVRLAIEPADPSRVMSERDAATDTNAVTTTAIGLLFLAAAVGRWLAGR